MEKFCGSFKQKCDIKNIIVYLLCLLILVIVHCDPPTGLSQTGFKMLGIAIISALLWSTDAAPIPITALIIIFLQTVLNITPLNEALKYIAHPVNALLFVGFSLAAGLKKYNLDKKISLKIIDYAGTNVRKLLFNIMAAVAFLSMWMSNTSTTAIMIPIVASILKMAEGDYENLGKAFMIGIAYAGTIGGMATPVGTTPNPITIAFLNEMVNINLTFLDWVSIGLPFVILLIPIAWLILILLYPPEIKEVSINSIQHFNEGTKSQDKIGVIKVYTYFGLLIFLWIGGSFFPVPRGWLYIVSLGGSILMYLPIVGFLNWKDTRDNVDWGVLILIGGGLSLGKGLSQSGVIDWIIGFFLQGVQGLPVSIIIILVVALTSISILFFCSITATSTAFVPFAISLALQVDANPVILAAAAGIASSFAFILPANTPPNAIAYSLGYFETKDMMKAGVILLVLCIVVFIAVSNILWPFIFKF